MSHFESACKSQGSASLISPLLQGSLFFTACHSQHLCACHQVWKNTQGQAEGSVPGAIWLFDIVHFKPVGKVWILTFRCFPIFLIFIVNIYCETEDWVDEKVCSPPLCCTYVLGDDKLSKGFTKSYPIHCTRRRCDVHILTIQQCNKIPSPHTHRLTHRQPKGNRGHETHMSLCLWPLVLCSKAPNKSAFLLFNIPGGAIRYLAIS